eukprot:jgi/Antlo1/1892/63
MAENLIVEIVRSIPPITRLIAISIFVVCFLVYTEAISPYKLTFSKPYINRLELHRVFTSFLYFGPPNLDTILHIIFLIRYSKMLEESFMNTCDYVYFLLIIKILVLVMALLWKITVLGPVFSSVITYVWTRKNPNIPIQLLGCFIFPAFYLPFVLPLFSLVNERKILKNEVLGIFVGHVYYFFKFVFPRFGCDPLRTPVFFQKLFGEYNPNKDASSSSATNMEISRTEECSEEQELDGKDNAVVEDRLHSVSAPRHSASTINTNEKPSGIDNISAVCRKHEDDVSAAGGSRNDQNHFEPEYNERSISYEIENSTLKDVRTHVNENSADTNEDSYLDIKEIERIQRHKEEK